MGGYNSSRWDGYQRKDTVEHSLKIDAGKLMKGVSDTYPDRPQGIQKSIYFTGGGSISVILARHGDVGGAIIAYHLRRSGRTITRNVSMVALPVMGGALRWLFLCPSCGRRCQKLYLPCTHYTFACRHCHDLTYAARQSRIKPPRSLGAWAEAFDIEVAMEEHWNKIKPGMRRGKRWWKRWAKLEARAERLRRRMGVVDNR
ncbi:MAG: hypothetical protein KC519_14030 [Anaerolineae bacterium]|nr:hypothetical protein [Anaerolineae bacterium]